MTQKDKKLLLKDLCARLPYGVKVSYNDNKDYEIGGYHPGSGLAVIKNTKTNSIVTTNIENIVPYLLPLSSMDDELKNVIKWKLTTPLHDSFDEDSLEDLLNNSTEVVNYCYEHHLDINGLIERGLALEALEEMYN